MRCRGAWSTSSSPASRMLRWAYQVEGVAITEAYFGGRTFGRVDVLDDRRTRRVLERRSFPPLDLCARVDPGTTRCPIPNVGRRPCAGGIQGAPVTPDPAIAAAFAPAVNAAVAQKRTPIGMTLTTPVRRAGTGDRHSGTSSPMRSWRRAGRGRLVQQHRWRTPGDLPAGPLTYGAVFETMPFDNRVVAFRLTGAELRKVLTTQAAGRTPLVGLPGLRIRVTCQGARSTLRCCVRMARRQRRRAGARGDDGFSGNRRRRSFRAGHASWWFDDRQRRRRRPGCGR